MRWLRARQQDDDVGPAEGAPAGAGLPPAWAGRADSFCFAALAQADLPEHEGPPSDPAPDPGDLPGEPPLPFEWVVDCGGLWFDPA
jgi:hypothetical protein